MNAQHSGIQVSRTRFNKPTDYYTRGRPRAPRVTNKQKDTLDYYNPWPPTHLGLISDVLLIQI